MKPGLATPPDLALEAEVTRDLDLLVADGKPIRREFPAGRLHIDRPLPFLCVHVGDPDAAADYVASTNASYLTTTDMAFAALISELVVETLRKSCGAFLLIDMGEFAKDRFLSDDVPFLPPFEIGVASGSSEPETAALARFSAAALSRKARYRTPRIEPLGAGPTRLPDLLKNVSYLAVRFAPIYRIPGGEGTYPELRDEIVTSMLDSGLQAVSAFLQASKIEVPATHRSFGRRAYVEAVGRADREIDRVASAFDFLLAVTPINSEQAWSEFKGSKFEQAPQFLYRPLQFEVGAAKRQLYAVSLDKLEDPLLAQLFAEKRQELDLQLSMIEARETRRFLELGRALYGGIEPSLMASAKTILQTISVDRGDDGGGPTLTHEAVSGAARDMISTYRRANADFDASVEVRADIPSGLMVTRSRLLVAKASAIPANRVQALLSHEIGVHLLTYFNGSAQGLNILRSGLAGYEATQEGLAVLAEYLVGGMTRQRLRLLAQRVICCDAMLDGATFPEVFDKLRDDCAMEARDAYHVAMRVCRGGGLAKDAIYLRGLLQVLSHLKRGGSLTPFWMGKVAANHFEAMQELAARGLLR